MQKRLDTKKCISRKVRKVKFQKAAKTVDAFVNLRGFVAMLARLLFISAVLTLEE